MLYTRCAFLYLISVVLISKEFVLNAKYRGGQKEEINIENKKKNDIILRNTVDVFHNHSKLKMALLCMWGI